ncbi:MAG: adaptor protein MecA [Eubacteriales bacterium]|nr:adaptor protein MecA [Eubacteriales bacterium]
MDFRRIDKNTVQCRMTEEEMNEFGLNIEDFFTDQEKSRDFLEQIVEMAEEEVGYEVESGMVSMQLMRMPDNSLTITFTDRGEDGLHNMLHQIQHLAGMIDDSTAEEIVDGLQQELEKEQNNRCGKAIHKEASEGESKHADAKDNKTQQKEYQKHMREIEKLQREKEKRKLNSAKVYEFQDFADLEQFAADYISTKNISSRVYRDKMAGKYYLLVKKGKLKMEEYQVLCQRLSDYGSICSEQPYVEQYCKEHFECLISKHALRVMREYY